jgi:glycosyltransferase involved in cell wall biosynthesis
LKEFSHYLNLDSVDFLGYRINKTLWDDFHGLLLPSRSEGFPLVVQEAMAAGRIVVTTFSGGSDEIIIDGENGFISEIDQDEFELAMERCWMAQNNWIEIAQNAYTSINDFLPDNPSENILAQIEELTFRSDINP